MEHDFWRGRWASNNITGFHEGAPNAFLQKHVACVGSARRILVPLCGKSVDLGWLAAQGHQVVGVELVEDAVRAFFEEHQLAPLVRQQDGFAIYSAGAVSVFCGDFFATTKALLGPVDALYDRAAIIALPQALRRRYVAHLGTLLPAGSPGLLIAVEYPQEQMDGPPFSVTAQELAGYRSTFSAKLLEQRPAKLPRLEAAGGVGAECCYEIALR